MSAGRPSSTPRDRRPTLGRPVLSARAGAALGVLVVLIAILALPFKDWVTQRARIAYIVADSSKIGERAFVRIGALADFDGLITDRRITDSQRSELEAAGVRVIVAGGDSAG